MSDERDEQAAINEQYDGIEDFYRDSEAALEQARADMSSETQSMDAQPTPDTDTMTPEEQAAASAVQQLLTPERMCMPVLLEQVDVVTPEGNVMSRYTFGFVNQLGQMIAAIGMNDSRVLATVVFSNDTGRKSIAQARRPRPGDIARGIDFKNGNRF